MANINLHNVLSLKATAVRQLVRGDDDSVFYTRDLVVLDNKGNTDTITLFSKEPLDLELFEVPNGAS